MDCEQPKIALCTTCKGRVAHIEETLPQNLADNAEYERCVVVLVDYNSKDNLADYVRQNHSAAIKNGRLAYYRFTEPTPFRMAHAKNLAHRLGIREGADILVNVDADNFTNAGFASYVAEHFHHDRVFLWSDMVKEGPGRLPRGISGRIAVSRHAFMASGGYDECFHTWSPDDKDFNLRLRRMGYDALEIDPHFLRAILHNDKVRFKEYPQAKTEQTAEDFLLPGREHVTVANQGNIGFGIVYRNFSKEPIAIEPIPTRIFGIGMHKTATTSLHEAFGILGYDSWHWSSAHAAKAIYEEMKGGTSKTLERYYAICDLPIPLLFRELDRAYPRSKFILTVREEAEWLESVRFHWSGQNRFRKSWNSDPFSHHVHKELYGRRDFDEDTMLWRYRRHNQEVKDHFKDRQKDLLVFDVSRGADWHELCGFLREPIPDVPYPHRFKSGEAA